jgi:hypothetical protein
MLGCYNQYVINKGIFSGTELGASMEIPHLQPTPPLKISPPMLVTKLFSGGGIPMGPENFRSEAFLSNKGR